MLRNVAILILLAFGASIQAQTLSFTSQLDASKEVQAVPVESDARGVGHLLINPETFEFKGFIFVRDLSDAVVGYHIHRGDPTVSGPVIVDLINSGLYTTTVVQKNGLTKITFSGTIQERTVGGVLLTPQDILGEILSGNTYFNVHTPTYPAGEVRGQVVPTMTP